MNRGENSTEDQRLGVTGPGQEIQPGFSLASAWRSKNDEVTPWRTLALLAAVLCGLGCEPASTDDGGPLPGVDIDLLEALEIARAQEPGGVAIEAELDAEGEPFFEIEMYVEAAAEVREVVIEGDGTVSDVVVDPEDLPKALLVVDAFATSVVSLDDAIAIAEAELDGDAFAASVDGTIAIEVVVVNAEDTVVLAVRQSDGTTMQVGGDPDD